MRTSKLLNRIALLLEHGLNQHRAATNSFPDLPGLEIKTTLTKEGKLGRAGTEIYWKGEMLGFVQSIKYAENNDLKGPTVKIAIVKSSSDKDQQEKLIKDLRKAGISVDFISPCNCE